LRKNSCIIDSARIINITILEIWHHAEHGVPETLGPPASRWHLLITGNDDILSEASQELLNLTVVADVIFLLGVNIFVSSHRVVVVIKSG